MKRFPDPLQALQDCHVCIEERLVALEALLERLADHGADPEARSTANAVVRYFDTAGSWHHQDEEEDLFPLLRALAATQGRTEIAAAIEELEREHGTVQGLWRALRANLDGVTHGQARLDTEQVARFAWLYRRHMDRESALVLPFALQALSSQNLAALGERMAARRTAPR